MVVWPAMAEALAEARLRWSQEAGSVPLTAGPAAANSGNPAAGMVLGPVEGSELSTGCSCPGIKEVIPCGKCGCVSPPAGPVPPPAVETGAVN
mmetsp:Transcript_85578/g.250563  ORF Transcript_85578/g.250563 Transcript_85578/m.250563 type:complete len:93 (-) Transcript_85578:146-424(-)